MLREPEGPREAEEVLHGVADVEAERHEDSELLAHLNFAQLDTRHKINIFSMSQRWVRVTQPFLVKHSLSYFLKVVNSKTYK